MVKEEKVEVKDEVAEVETLKKEIALLKAEKEQYRLAYERAVDQNTSLWGMYSNLTDYVVTQTQRKQGN